MAIILASASPRRTALLSALSIPHVAVESDVDESSAAASSVEELVTTLARRKAEAVARRVGSGLVVGADSVVELEGEPLGKPGTPRRARDMLRRLSGRNHRVMTGVALVATTRGETHIACEKTQVTLRHLDDATIDAYVQTGEPLDKAGAYAIQGAGRSLIEHFDGCYPNVVGLPLCVVVRWLRRLGVLPVSRWATGKPPLIDHVALSHCTRPADGCPYVALDGVER